MEIHELASAIGAPATAIIIVLWILKGWYSGRNNKKNKNPGSLNGVLTRMVEQLEANHEVLKEQVVEQKESNTLQRLTNQRVDDIWDKVKD